MGIIKSEWGDLTPICNDCGVSLCWDISQEEYDSRPLFWDNWVCKNCKDVDKTRFVQHLTNT